MTRDFAAQWGSSPLTRGKQRSRRSSVARLGLIPAHAGKTVEEARHRVEVEAHPRSRGENRSSSDPILGGYGSSPLTRGKPTDVGRKDQPQGLIPAHAGKT